MTTLADTICWRRDDNAGFFMVFFPELVLARKRDVRADLFPVNSLSRPFDRTPRKTITRDDLFDDIAPVPMSDPAELVGCRGIDDDDVRSILK